MNKRQIKKRVKRAKINKECGMILSLEDRHYMRHYGGYYHTKKEVDDFNSFFAGMPKIIEEAVALLVSAWIEIHNGFYTA